MTHTDTTGDAAYKQLFLSYSPFVVLVWWGCFGLVFGFVLFFFFNLRLGRQVGSYISP